MAQTWRDEPATGGHVETREEVLARVAAEKRETQTPEMTTGRDPSTRRGMQRKTVRTFVVAAVVGYLIALGIGWVVSGNFWIGAGGGFAGALVGAVLASFLLLEREDGRVSDETAAYAPERQAPDQNSSG